MRTRLAEVSWSRWDSLHFIADRRGVNIELSLNWIDHGTNEIKWSVLMKNCISTYFYSASDWIPEAMSFLGLAIPNKDAFGAFWVYFSSFSYWDVHESGGSKDAEVFQVWFCLVPDLVWC